MSDEARTMIKGESYDTEQLAEMGLLPPGMLLGEAHQLSSVVTNVDPATRTITFDTLPHGGDGFAPVERGPQPSAHKSIHDYQEQLKAKRRRKKRR